MAGGAETCLVNVSQPRRHCAASSQDSKGRAMQQSETNRWHHTTFFPTQQEQANPSEESKYLNSANNYLSKELTQTKTPTHTHVLVHAQHVTANLTLRNQREKKKKKSVDLSYGTY